MKIGIPYNQETGDIMPHFGHTNTFKIYDIEDGKIINSTIKGTDGKEHAAMFGLFTEWGLNGLIIGGMGSKAVDLLTGMGLTLYAGVSGSADAAAEALAAGTLSFSNQAECGGH